MMASTEALFGREKLAGNILHFARVLRAAGLPIGPAKVVVALNAVEAVGVGNRDDFRAALESVLIERHEHRCCSTRRSTCSGAIPSCSNA
jgi:uncharacterized protein with von Willebrand factor type A (vWA) domain